MCIENSSVSITKFILNFKTSLEDSSTKSKESINLHNVKILSYIHNKLLISKLNVNASYSICMMDYGYIFIELDKSRS